VETLIAKVADFTVIVLPVIIEEVMEVPEMELPVVWPVTFDQLDEGVVEATTV